MNPSFRNLILTLFALMALLPMAIVACSSPTDVDSGTSELVGGGPYGGGAYGVYGVGYTGYGYGAGVNYADDYAP